MQRASGFLHKGSLVCVSVCVFVGGVKRSKRHRGAARLKIIFVGLCICKLTAICLAAGSGSGYFSAVLVHAPTLPPVALQLPVEAVLVAAGDELSLNWNSNI